MVAADQPTIFDNNKLVVAVSSRDDGQMQLGWREPDKEVVENRHKFLAANNISLDSTVLVRIKYRDEATYDVIREVTAADAGTGMRDGEASLADCLVTTTPGIALFLPIADCVATVVYDPMKNVLALAHLGRHSTLADLARKLVTYLGRTCDSHPADLQVWMAPSIRPPHYVLKYAHFAEHDPRWNDFCEPLNGGFSIDVAGFNRARFQEAGVKAENISLSSVDTAINEQYWSHQIETEVRGNTAPPRFAVVAMIR